MANSWQLRAPRGMQLSWGLRKPTCALLHEGRTFCHVDPVNVRKTVIDMFPPGTSTNSHVPYFAKIALRRRVRRGGGVLGGSNNPLWLRVFFLLFLAYLSGEVGHKDTPTPCLGIFLIEDKKKMCRDSFM